MTGHSFAEINNTVVKPRAVEFNAGDCFSEPILMIAIPGTPGELCIDETYNGDFDEDAKGVWFLGNATFTEDGKLEDWGYRLWVTIDTLREAFAKMGFMAEFECAHPLDRLKFKGSIAAPGYGQSWECEQCGEALWSAHGKEAVISYSEMDAPPELSIEDIL